MPNLIERDYRRDSDIEMLNGLWVMAEARLGGVPLPADAFAGLSLHVRNGHFVLGNDEGTITIDGRVSPSAMDIVATHGPNTGRFVPAIFEHAGGTLRICYDLSGRQRPREFKAPPGTRRLLATYRRSVIRSTRDAARVSV